MPHGFLKLGMDSKNRAIESKSFICHIFTNKVAFMYMSLDNAFIANFATNLSFYEILSAPISSLEMIIGYIGAAATKSVIDLIDSLFLC